MPLTFHRLNLLSALVLRALVFIPLSMAFWWFEGREQFLRLLEWLVSLSTYALLPDKILGIESNGMAWLVKTSLSTVNEPLRSVGIPMPTNRFTVGFGLLWGLVLATPGAFHGWRFLKGLGILLLAVLLIRLGWGDTWAISAAWIGFMSLIVLACDVFHWRQIFLGTLMLIPVATLMALMLVQFQLALYINHQPILTEVPRADYVLVLPYPAYLYYLMAVGRQLATLVLPTLAPLMIWSLMNRRFIQGIILESVLSQEHHRSPSPN